MVARTVPAREVLRVRVLVAFDVDGTLECGQPPGPVPLAQLAELTAAGVGVAIVSPSGARPAGAPYPEFLDGDRVVNLRAAAAAFGVGLWLYVSDNRDQAAAREAGFSYIEAADFVASRTW